MNSESAVLTPARLRIAAFAGLAQCDGNRLLDCFFLCRRMTGAYRSALLPVIHQCLDVAADNRLAGSFSEGHAFPPDCGINWPRFSRIAAVQPDVPLRRRNDLFVSRQIGSASCRARVA